MSGANIGRSMNAAQVIKHIGGPTVVGGILGVSRQAVVQWRMVPVEYVLTLARKSPVPITPHEIRADIYPHPLDGLRHRAAARKRANGKRARAA